MEITLPIAFIGGLFSSLSPCCIPLFPSYIAYIGGIHLEKKKTKNENESLQIHVLIQTLIFVLGFTIVFVLLGLAIGGLGGLLRKNGLLIQQIGGILFIFFGLQMLNLLPEYAFSTLSESIRVKTRKIGGSARSFLFGIMYATVWTPCVGPILGTVLTLAAFSGASYQGALLLFVYAFGVSVPFWIVAFAFSQSDKLFKTSIPVFAVLHKIGGVLLIIMGILFLTNGFSYLNSYLNTVIPMDFLYNWEEKLYKL